MSNQQTKEELQFFLALRPAYPLLHKPRDTTSDPRTFRSLMVFVALGAGLSIASVIATRRFLYADSSYTLLAMWERESFFIPSPGRWFASIASQWLPVLAMQLGWRNLGGIATLFGLNLWMNPVLAVLAVWWASGRSREITLLVLFCEVFLFQTIYVMIEGESSVSFWLTSILLILTLRKDFAYPVLLLFLPILFTHDSVVAVLAPILAVLLVWRRGYVRYYGAARFWSLVAVLALVVVLISWRAAGPDPNRAYFLSGALQTPLNPTFVLTALAFGSLFLQVFRPGLAWPPRVFWASTGLLLLLPFALPELIWPFYHYRSRALNAVLAVIVFAYLHGRVHWRLPSPAPLATRSVLALVFVVFAFQGRVTWEWREHMRHFRTELADVRGVIQFPLDGPFADPRSRQFSWSWTTPVRSVVFQAMSEGEVRAIMLNADTARWQPFRPNFAAELPDLSAFGVRYAPELVNSGGNSVPATGIPR